MAKKKTEVVEETTKQENPIKEEPKVDNTVEKIKVKKKPSMKKFSNDPDGVTKVDLSKPPKTEKDEQPVDATETGDVQEKVIEETSDKKEVTKQSTKEDSEQPVLEEITDKKEVTEQVTEKSTEQPVIEEVTEETTEEQVAEAIVESQETGEPLPENIQKLVNFMEETGGDLEDYVALKRDYDKYDDSSLLMEYYASTKPHLTEDEIRFTLEDQFSWDQDEDDEVEIKRKQLALKEQVANAITHLDGLKSKYYEDIKSGSKLTGEQQKAIDFFNRYNKESKKDNEAIKVNQKIFIEKTNQVFNDKFKGFEYNIGDKKFRFNVKDVGKVKQDQSDLSNFVEKFLGNKSQLEDGAGYHKSLFTAMNADTIANHFYEQGKADAMKNSVAKAKNIDMTPRQSHGEIETGGLKFKVLGDTADDFKFKIKRK